MRRSLIVALGFATLGVLSAPQPLFAASALMNHPAPAIYRANGGVTNGGVTNGGTISGGGSNSAGGTTNNGGVINGGGGTTNSGTVAVRNGNATHGGLGGGASATQFKAR